jgi:hypothetical protein
VIARRSTAPNPCAAWSACSVKPASGSRNVFRGVAEIERWEVVGRVRLPSSAHVNPAADLLGIRSAVADAPAPRKSLDSSRGAPSACGLEEVQGLSRATLGIEGRSGPAQAIAASPGRQSSSTPTPSAPV